MKDVIAWPVAILGSAGAAPLVIAWWAEHAWGMAPCELCLWERWPYRVLVAAAFLAAMLSGRPRRMLPLVALAVSACAMGIAGMHVGVEQGWWPSPLSACSAPVFHGGTFAERLASMPARPSKPCDVSDRLVRWLPVSMTTLDFIYAAALGTMAAFVYRHGRNRNSTCRP